MTGKSQRKDGYKRGNIDKSMRSVLVNGIIATKSRAFTIPNYCTLTRQVTSKTNITMTHNDPQKQVSAFPELKFYYKFAIYKV